MFTQCLKCGNEDIRQVELTKDMVVNKTDDMPDIFPLNFGVCDYCQTVPRGEIVSTLINSVVDYKNPNGAREAHYHKTGWHFEWVIKGQFYYYERPMNSTDRPEPLLVTKGQLLYIKSMVEHGLIFQEQAVLLSLINKGRPKGDSVPIDDDFLRSPK